MIHRIEHKDNFTVISNDTIRNPELPDGAFRLLSFMLSCADDWDFSVKGLAYVLNISESVVKYRLKELKKFGYVRTRKVQNEKGYFGEYVWDVYEEPYIRSTKNPTSEKTDGRKNPTSDKSEVGKIDPIRNNNDKEITNIKERTKGRKAHALGIFQNVFLSDSEQESLCKKFGFDSVGEYIDRLSEYLNEHPNKHYQNHKSTIEKWIVEDKERNVI